MVVERPTRLLAQSPLFQSHTEHLPLNTRFLTSQKRAKAIVKAYGLSRNDLLTLSPRFWQLHTDPIWSMDGAAGTLCTLALNCCAGTLSMFARGRSDLDDIIDKVMRFEILGQFCLTEVGYGLDVFNMRTTATLLENGEFDLHTPVEAASKYMPPTTPVGGKACVAVVFARTIVKGQDHGIKPYLVHIHDGEIHTPGVRTQLLPQRGGSRPLNHALTSFNHVRLSASALLGSIDKPADPRAAFFMNVSRVTVGTIAIGSLGVPALQISSTLAARYSLRRKVIDHQSGTLRPIISFQTSKTPILSAVAQAFVMKAFHHYAVNIFRTARDPRIKFAMATTLKITMIELAQAAHLTLGDRCGAQGLFEVNQLAAMHADMRGTAIAEGDLLVTCIRLASELLLGRYALPESSDPTSLPAQHEAGLFKELSSMLGSFTGHRSDDYNRLILPESTKLVKAIGHRMAHDAAVAAGVDGVLISLFDAHIIGLDPAWYSEVAGISRAAQKRMEADAVDAVFPRLEEFLQEMDADPYISAPMISEERWSEYLYSLRSPVEEAIATTTPAIPETPSQSLSSAIITVKVPPIIDPLPSGKSSSLMSWLWSWTPSKLSS